jgi:ATP-dependent Lhr-like helicase
VLRLIRRKSLARLRKEVEPVEQRTLARFATHWQGVMTPRRGMDALLDAIEGLQGAPLVASLLETRILPARVAGYQAGDLDRLIAAGEVSWAGWEPLGERDGRVRLFLADSMAALTAIESDAGEWSEGELRLLEILRTRGASFFEELYQAMGGGYPGETVEALWSLVWRGRVTNDSLHPLRAYVTRQETRRGGQRRTVHAQQGSAGYRSRRAAPATATGRWSVIAEAKGTEAMTAALHATARQLLRRYGVLLRENVTAENVPGGFSAVYPVLNAMEESGQVRRGYFVAGLGATQFALPAAVDLLRSLRTAGESSMADAERTEFVLLAATDPANPYGSAVKWPELPADANETEYAPRTLTRAMYAQVVLCRGWLAAWLRRGNPHVVVFLPEDEPERSAMARGLARFLAEAGRERMEHEDGEGRLITTVNGVPVVKHPWVHALAEAGFVAGPLGMHLRRGVGATPRLTTEEAARNLPTLPRPDAPVSGRRRS